MQEPELLERLQGVGRLIDNHEAALVELYATRLRLFQIGRREHSLTHARLGQAAGCKENSVIAALRKAEKQAAAQTAEPAEPASQPTEPAPTP